MNVAPISVVILLSPDGEEIPSHIATSLVILDIMSVNRYNPYHTDSTATRGPTGQYPTQSSTNAPATHRNFEPAVWQWVPDAPQDLQGPYRVLMSGLPTENVAKKEIIVGYRN